MTYFTGCKTVAEVKSKYRELMQAYHPDHGGDIETAKAINAELETVLSDIMGGRHTDWKEQREAAGSSTYSNFSGGVFGAILSELVKLNVTIEIIGYWIYVFDCYEAKDQLKAMGLWWSKKHKAWIYSGGKKLKVRTALTTDDNRMRLGSELIKEKEKRRSIPA